MPVLACFTGKLELKRELAALSQAAHDNISIIQHSRPKGGVVALRKMARILADKQIKAIDLIAKQGLGL